MDMKVTKISYQPQINKTSYTQRVKHFFTRNPHGIKIKVLLEDVFDSTINRSGWFGYLRASRDLPNYVSGPEEDYSFTNSNNIIKFSAKDEKILNSLDGRDFIDYRMKLIKERKYTIKKEEY